MALVVDLFAFAPSAKRADELDRRIRAALADSLATICAALEDRSNLTPKQLQILLSRIRSRQVRPAIFALYTKLVHAIELDDNEQIDRLAEELKDPIILAPATHRVVTLSEGMLRSDIGKRYCDVIDDDSGTPRDLSPVTDQQFMDGVDCVRVTLGLLVRVAPEIADEIRLFGQELVLATQAPGAAEFGGATSFYLWGAIFINPTAHG